MGILSVAAAKLKALGDETRLRIYLCLKGCAKPVALGEGGEVHPVDGLTVGEVCCQVSGVDRITSTLSHHLKELKHAGLIRMEKHGRFVFCSAIPGADDDVLELLTHCCCPPPKS